MDDKKYVNVQFVIRRPADSKSDAENLLQITNTVWNTMEKIIVPFAQDKMKPFQISNTGINTQRFSGNDSNSFQIDINILDAEHLSEEEMTSHYTHVGRCYAELTSQNIPRIVRCFMTYELSLD
jgi:hypothetical protein